MYWDSIAIEFIAQKNKNYSICLPKQIVSSVFLPVYFLVLVLRPSAAVNTRKHLMSSWPKAVWLQPYVSFHKKQELKTGHGVFPFESGMSDCQQCFHTLSSFQIPQHTSGSLFHVLLESFCKMSAVLLLFWMLFRLV